MNESIHDLVELYVLDALSTEENTEFERHLLSCESCQSELDSYLAVSDELDMLPNGDPPAELKASVMAAIAKTPQISAVPQPISDTEVENPAFVETSTVDSGKVIDFASERKRRRGSWAAAAAAACVAAVLGIVALNGAGDPSYDDIASIADAEFAEFDAEASGELRVTWSTSTDNLAISGSGLAQLPPDKVYELWIIADADPIPAGLFIPDPDGNVDFVSELVEEPAVWAVTIEDAAGADAPTTDPIFVAAL